MSLKPSELDVLRTAAKIAADEAEQEFSALPRLFMEETFARLEKETLTGIRTQPENMMSHDVIDLVKLDFDNLVRTYKAVQLLKKIHNEGLESFTRDELSPLIDLMNYGTDCCSDGVQDRQRRDAYMPIRLYVDKHGKELLDAAIRIANDPEQKDWAKKIDMERLNKEIINPSIGSHLSRNVSR